MSSNSDFSLLAKIINGSIAGVVGVTSCFPLDLVKTRLQGQRIGPNGEKTYSSIIDCFKKVYAAGGIRGMYRGVGVTVSLATPEKMVKLASNDYFRHHLTSKDGSLSVFRQTIAGGLAGVCQIVISTPLELMKINLQMDQKSQSARQLFLSIVREKGIFGMYKGLQMTAARDILFNMIYFPTFASANKMGPKRPDGNATATWSLLSGFFAGTCAAVTVTPIDVVKTRIQAYGGGCQGIVDCINDTLQKEGISAFFKGGLCRMMVLAPLFGIAQAFYFLGVGEAIVNFFSKKDGK